MRARCGTAPTRPFSLATTRTAIAFSLSLSILFPSRGAEKGIGVSLAWKEERLPVWDGFQIVWFFCLGGKLGGWFYWLGGGNQLFGRWWRGCLVRMGMGMSCDVMLVVVVL